jgi:hypothetical protein
MSIAAPRVSTHTAKLVFVMGVNKQRVEFVSQPSISQMEKSSNQVSKKREITHPAQIRMGGAGTGFFQGPGPAHRYEQTDKNATEVSRSPLTSHHHTGERHQ